jgi:hypothetical protein
MTASWNEYEGYHPVVTGLTGILVGRTIRLAGVNSEGKVEFNGELAGKHLKGTLVWYIGTNRQTKKIDLARTTRPVRPPE